MADGELAGPVDYAAGWWVLAIGLLVAVVAWNLGVLAWGRPRRVPAPNAPAVDVAALRRAYLSEIDRIEAAHASGELDLRAAHRRLSAASRAFVAEVTGAGTRAMTLAQLRERDLGPLVDVVEIAYPPAFGPGSVRPPEELPRALTTARAAVNASWS